MRIEGVIAIASETEPGDGMPPGWAFIGKAPKDLIRSLGLPGSGPYILLALDGARVERAWQAGTGNDQDRLRSAPVLADPVGA